jgi:hypothetical protein
MIHRHGSIIFVAVVLLTLIFVSPPNSRFPSQHGLVPHRGSSPPVAGCTLASPYAQSGVGSGTVTSALGAASL